MNKIENALYELGRMDALASGDSPVHRLHPLAKLPVTAAFILVTVSFHKYDLTGMAAMMLFPVIAFQLSGIPVRTCFYKLRIVLPLVMAVGILNPFFDRTVVMRTGHLVLTGGVLSMLTLMLKGVLCLMASFLLVSTTSIDALCAALRKLHVPSMLVTLLLLTFRYVGLMMEEVAVMTDAYRLRAPGQKGIHYRAWGSFLGQLLLRSMDRARELYSGMQLRGFRGEFFYADTAPFGAADGAWLLGWTAVFLVFRCVPVAQLLGSLVVR